MKAQRLPLVLTVPCIAVGAAFSATFLGGTSIDLPHTFQSGTPARASEVNENFDTLVSSVENLAADTDAQFATVALDIDALDTRTTALEDIVDEIADPENFIVVSASGGDFTSVAAALASITDASDTNRYLVYVAPGVYTETTASTVQSFVTLKGAGASASVVRADLGGASPGSATSVVILESDGAIEDLSIENTATSQNAFGINGAELSRETRIANCEIRVTGNGGVGHTAIRTLESNLVIENCVLEASGASTVNAGYASIDNGGAFALPILRGCEIDADGASAGIGIFVSRTNATVIDSIVVGDQHAMSANGFGTSTVRNSQMQTANNNPVYEQTNLAEIHSGYVRLMGGQAQGTSFRFRFVWCTDGNFNPVNNT